MSYNLGFKCGVNVYKYRDFDGKVSLSQQHALMFWDLVLADGLDRVLFYDGPPLAGHEFVKVVEREDKHFFFGWIKGTKEPFGFFWLDPAGPRSAFIHYCILKRWWGTDYVSAIGREILDAVLSAKTVAGDHLFDVVLGLTPKRMRLAMRMLEVWGMRRLGFVPCGCYHWARNCSEDAVLSCCTREDLAR